ncbi:hypothetical protein VDG1235_4021 [Verrucomicrobiia bacterium DG1235]|nr:hypothetical protein VDG1235_4021 [Verrucomicrobiae bacterium DG1235]
MRIDGVEVRGDVEVHFSRSDWRAHGHDFDPAYNSVVLHVLYHKASGSDARTASGVDLPSVSLLPLLWYSLEEYAGEDSLVESTGVDLRPETETLLGLDLSARKKRLVELALRRWRMKVHYARQRIERLGWEGACHQGALEVMGFARNRVPMLMIAERYGLDDFAAGRVTVEELLEAGGDRWRFNGCRPANHPRLRLQQYLEVGEHSPLWPERLLGFIRDSDGLTLDPVDSDWGTASIRQDLGIAVMRKELLAQVLAKRIGGAKADTLVCDALLPLLSAQSGRDAFALWFHWNAGNGPESCVEALRILQVLEPRTVPMSNGWLQGILGARIGSSSDRAGLAGSQADA